MSDQNQNKNRPPAAVKPVATSRPPGEPVVAIQSRVHDDDVTSHALVDDHVFVVVREDRHASDEITVHRTLDDACGAFDGFKEKYSNRPDLYRWFEGKPGRDFDGKAGHEDSRWIRYARTTSDDGPAVRIEKMPLRGRARP